MLNKLIVVVLLQLYKLEKEHEEAFSLRHTFAKDFDNVVKVDTHIHHSACMRYVLLVVCNSVHSCAFLIMHSVQ